MKKSLKTFNLWFFYFQILNSKNYYIEFLSINEKLFKIHSWSFIIAFHCTIISSLTFSPLSLLTNIPFWLSNPPSLRRISCFHTRVCSSFPFSFCSNPHVCSFSLTSYSFSLNVCSFLNNRFSCSSICGSSCSMIHILFYCGEISYLMIKHSFYCVISRSCCKIWNSFCCTILNSCYQI